MTSGVLVVGPVPPPIHGAARVHELVVRNLEQYGAHLHAVDTSGSAPGSGALYHLERAALHARACWVAQRWRRSLASIYLTGAGGAGLWYQLVVILVARLAGVPVVFHHHSYAYLTRRRAAMRAIVAAAGTRAVHVALCAGMAETLRSRYPGVGRTLVCSNAGLFAPAEPRPAAAGAAAPLVLGHLGNLVVEKGLATTVDTVRELRGEGLDVRLLLAGPAPTAESRAILARAQDDLGEALEYLGPVPADEVDRFYERIDVLLFPSRYVHEAEPMVVLEASRCEVPTVAYAVGCLPNLVAGSGRLVSTDEDFGAAARATVAELDDPEARARARVAVRERFEIRRVEALAAHDELVRVLVGERR